MSETASRVSVESILDYLTWAEANEPDVWLRDDYRIAWITVVKAARGELQPHFWATYAVLRTAPVKVWPNIVRARKAMLGSLYYSFFADESLPPKKPSQSVGVPFRDGKRAA